MAIGQLVHSAHESKIGDKTRQNTGAPHTCTRPEGAHYSWVALICNAWSAHARIAQLAHADARWRRVGTVMNQRLSCMSCDSMSSAVVMTFELALKAR